ncbi:MAG: hypothetical protein QM539_00315 [Alphaproteobacteria bacterium]|nr:hypothetical protein [Alphaproteobacteria bacterium]
MKTIKKSLLCLFIGLLLSVSSFSQKAKEFIYKIPKPTSELYSTLIEGLLKIGYNIEYEDKTNQVIKAKIVVFTAIVNLDCRITSANEDGIVTCFATKNGIGPKERIYKDASKDIYVKLLEKFPGVTYEIK